MVVEFVEVHHPCLRVKTRINETPQARGHGLANTHISVELILDARGEPKLLRLLLPPHMSGYIPATK
jgi:hypothetical protein